MSEISEKIECYLNYFVKELKELGGVKRNQEKYILRNNTPDPLPEKGAYFGCISEDEEKSGPYSDLCVVVFPSNEDETDANKWIVSFAVGSLGYKNDDQLVTLPGLRRSFVKTLPQDSFIKNDFFDIETSDGFNSYCNSNDIPFTLENAVSSYKNVVLVASIFDPSNEENAKDIISKYLALYADMRGWPQNKAERTKVKQLLSIQKEDRNEKDDVKELLKSRKYVVLQGAPGTGKTRLAKEIAEDDENSITFFTQFHAETTYSDFIYGIVPDIDHDKLVYKEHRGIFVKAVEAANKNPDRNIYLIIDEINRANLSNVLGPTFYLLEPSMSDSNVEIEVCPGLTLERMPENVYVIATMNTADRSLAVVDFALRRRFAWYTLKPHVLKKVNKNQYFCEQEFNEISKLFEKYATDEELNLQPGHAYFIVSKDGVEEEMNARLEYEIMPLVKEYLVDGMLNRARDAFVNYFRKKINVEMFI